MTPLLLDTLVLIWALVQPEKISTSWIKRITDGNDVLFSSANIWEVAIKYGLRRPGFIFEPSVILDGARAAGFTELPIGAEHVVDVHSLPHHLRDPFDRLLIAQARRGQAILLTADRPLLAYGAPVELIG